MDDFHLITCLGSGSCGSVHLVRQISTKKLFALKRIQPDETKKNRTKEAILKEARILSELRHPNIVGYHSSFFDCHTGLMCIIQDYCDGGCLEERIFEARKNDDYFPESNVLKWFIQITMAVQYMHFKKILHRDLKTQNVFLTKKSNFCKIGDFGISKMLDQSIDVASTCVGTPCYLSPEMCEDIPYSSKSDIWALGCLLYELCALKSAFDANNILSLFRKIIKAEFEPIPFFYSKSLASVVEALLIKSPEDRPSARQILNFAFLKNHVTEYIEQHESQIKLLQEKSSNINNKDKGNSPDDMKDKKHQSNRQDNLLRESGVGKNISDNCACTSKLDDNSISFYNIEDVESNSNDCKVEYLDDFETGSESSDNESSFYKDDEYEDDFEELDAEDVCVIIDQAKELQSDYSNSFEEVVVDEDVTTRGFSSHLMKICSSDNNLFTITEEDIRLTYCE